MAVLPIPALPTKIADLSGVKRVRIVFSISSSLAIAGFVTYNFVVKFSPYFSKMLSFFAGSSLISVFFLMSFSFLSSSKDKVSSSTMSNKSSIKYPTFSFISSFILYQKNMIFTNICLLNLHSLL